MSANTQLDIEEPLALVNYLREHGCIAPDETPDCTTLGGGVSNRVVLVRRGSGESWVIKQALNKLRVKADWFSDPARVQREALGLRWLAELAPPHTTTPLVFEDKAVHLLAMQAVPRPHANWKQLLLAGELLRDHVEQFGAILGTIHRRSAGRRAEIEPVFADRTFFESLRVEPYYQFTAGRNAGAARFYDDLIAETRATRTALVHGDFSPKNILVHDGRLVLLDHEVIHWGDPAFDLGFALTHLLAKANFLSEHRGRFITAAGWFWNDYRTASGGTAATSDLEARAVRHTLACLLARVDGRSPLEYLTGAARKRQRIVTLALMKSPPAALPELFQMFAERLDR